MEQTRYRIMGAHGQVCCASNRIEHLCGSCRSQVRGTAAARTTATARPATPPPPAPRATAPTDGLTPAELFRAVVRTGWQTRQAVTR